MSFGIHFGELIARHRGEQGLSQRALAIRAFDDESRKPRISELERGKVDNPAIEIVDALTVALKLSAEDVSACRTKGRQRAGVLTEQVHVTEIKRRDRKIEALNEEIQTLRESLSKKEEKVRIISSILEAGDE